MTESLIDFNEPRRRRLGDEAGLDATRLGFPEAAEGLQTSVPAAAGSGRPHIGRLKQPVEVARVALTKPFWETF